MRRRVSAVAAVAVTAAVTTAGCVQNVDGAPVRVQAASEPDRDYGYTDDRCGLLPDSTVAQVLSADNVVRPYSGAVCQYVLSRESTAEDGAGALPVMLDVTFSWFEAGSLERERALAQERGARITDTVISRRSAFLARRDTTGVACSAMAAAGSGVLAWWVQYRDQTNGDPCPEAAKLLSKTLSAEM